MALSNIFNEPRREITETVVGAVVVFGASAIFLLIDYLVALVIMYQDPIWSLPKAMACALVFCIIVVVVVSTFASVIHQVGESSCAALDKRGIQLRPRQRYAKRAK